MSKKTQTALKAAAIVLTLFSLGAQARPFMPEPTGQAPAGQAFALSDQPTLSSTEAILLVKHPVPAMAPQTSSMSSEAPRAGTVEAQQRAKYPWLYRAN